MKKWVVVTCALAGLLAIVAARTTAQRGIPALVIPVAMDCETQPSLCQIMTAADFINDLATITTRQNPYDKLSDYVENVTGRQPVLIKLPPLLVNRNRAIRAIFHMEAQTLQLVRTKLGDDVRRLSGPFSSDSEGEKQRKMAIVQRDVAAVNRQVEKAKSEMSSEQNRAEKSSDSYQPKFGQAYRQLVTASKTGSGILPNW